MEIDSIKNTLEMKTGYKLIIIFTTWEILVVGGWAGVEQIKWNKELMKTRAESIKNRNNERNQWDQELLS